MKLSEMPTQKAAECMAEIAGPIENIAKSELVVETMKEFVEGRINKGTTVIRLIPVLCRDCWNDTMHILSALTDKPAEIINSQPIKETMADLKGCLDAELLSFFG